MPSRGPRSCQQLQVRFALPIPITCHQAEQPLSSDGQRAPGPPLSRTSEGLRASRPLNSRLRTARATSEECALVPHRLQQAARPSAGGSPLAIRGTQGTTHPSQCIWPSPTGRANVGRQPGPVERPSGRAMPVSPPATLRRGHESRPNPSLEATLHGLALGPRGARWHHAPRGPSTNPRRSPQLKR